MDLKPLDLLWVEGVSTSWSHPGDLAEFSEIPGLAVVSDQTAKRKRPLLSQVSLPSHRLPPSEFDVPPTLALHMVSHQGVRNRSIALQLSLFPSTVTCSAPGGDGAWKSALQLERELFHHGCSGEFPMKDHLPGTSRHAANANIPVSDKKRTRGANRPVICEFRRTSGLSPQLSRYLRPGGKEMVIQFLKEDEIVRTRN